MSRNYARGKSQTNAALKDAGIEAYRQDCAVEAGADFYVAAREEGILGAPGPEDIVEINDLEIALLSDEGIAEVVARIVQGATDLN